MKNSRITIWFLLFWATLLTSCNPSSTSLIWEWETDIDVNERHNTENPLPDEQEISSSEIIRQRIESIRKRHELSEMLINAELYLEGWQQALWLRTLLNVYRENPSDWIVVTKIAETYYEMKRFWSSLNYYMRLPSLNERQKQRVKLLHFYSNDLTTEDWRQNLVRELKDMILEEQDLRYYMLSILCISEPQLCRDRFTAYISTLDSISSEKLNDMRLAIRNYENFWLDEDYLLYTYVITEWYKQWLYPLTVILWEQVMNERSQYKPAIKLVWHSLFELWRYEESKEILTSFHRIDDSDPWVNYMLGIIYAKTRDAVLANIFLRRALELWYTPTLNIRRHIAYNFALIESRHNLLRSLEEIINLEDDYEKTDLSLAIYYHIIFESPDKAIRFAQIGQEKYPDDAYFYGYEWWGHRELWNTQKAIEVLQNWLDVIPNNPFLYFQLVFALKESWNYDSMKLIIERILSLDITDEYREVIERERELLINN